MPNKIKLFLSSDFFKRKALPCLLFFVFAAGKFYSLLGHNTNFAGYLEEGENWLFVFKDGFSGFYFPASLICDAVFTYNLPDALGWLPYAVMFFPAVLAFLLGSLLYSYWGGLFSALAVTSVSGLFASGACDQILLTGAVIALIIYDSGKFKEGLPHQIVLSLLLCALLQSKGVAFPLVAAFIIYPLFTEGRKKFLRLRLLPLTAVLAVSFTWGAVNRSAGNSFVLFTENSERAAENICAGLKGFVTTTEGDFFGDVLCDSKTDNIYYHAVAETVRHPVLFFSSVASRFVYLFSVSVKDGAGIPVFLFFTAGFLSVFFRRFRTRGTVSAWLAAVYLFAIHICMPVQTNYFTPSLILFAMLAGLLPACFFRRLNERPAGRICKKAFCFFASPLILVWLAAFVLMALFPLRSRNPADAGALAAKYPDNMLLQRVAGDMAVEECRSDRAAGYYDSLYRLSDKDRYWRHVQSLFLKDKKIGYGIFTDGKWKGEYPVILYYALDSYDKNDPGAADSLSCALQMCMIGKYYVRGLRNASEIELNDKLRKRGAAECVSEMENTLEQLSDKSRTLSIREKIRRLSPELTYGADLFGIYEEEKEKACAADKSPGSCIMPFDTGFPEACGRSVPELKKYRNGTDFRNINVTVGYPICKKTAEDINGEISDLFNKCICYKPDFSALAPMLELCGGAVEKYEKNSRLADRKNREQFPYVLLQKAHVLKAMGRRKDAAAAAAGIRKIKESDKDVRKGAEVLLKELNKM